MNKLRQLISSISDECAVPENIRTPPTEGTGISWGWGFSETKNLKKRMKLNSNFQRGGGGGPFNFPPYFLELHNLKESE